MDYSAANTSLWGFIIQLALIAGAILLATFLRQKVPFIRRSLMPVAVLGGFLLLIVKYTGLIHVDNTLMEMLVYHGRPDAGRDWRGSEGPARGRGCRGTGRGLHGVFASRRISGHSARAGPVSL